MDDHSHVEFDELRSENAELKKRVDELEELLTKVCAEITEIKKFEWGCIEDPPTIKKGIC